MLHEVKIMQVNGKLSQVALLQACKPAYSWRARPAAWTDNLAYSRNWQNNCPIEH